MNEITQENFGGFAAVGEMRRPCEASGVCNGRAPQCGACQQWRPGFPRLPRTPARHDTSALGRGQVIVFAPGVIEGWSRRRPALAMRVARMAVAVAALCFIGGALARHWGWL